MEIAILVEMRHGATHQAAHGFQRRAGGERAMEVAALRRGQQLDADHAAGILDHFQQASCAVGRHRDMIFLIGRGRDRIDAGRMGALLVLRDECGRRHLRDHEARAEAWMRRQEGRQAGQGGIDQHGNPPLGQRADLADRERDDVGGEGHRLGVEVAARQRLVRFREDQRIVGDAVGLGRERLRRLAQYIERGAHDLRLAAQTVGILHALVADQMRGADGGPLHQAAQRIGRIDLTLMTAQQMNARIEWRVGAARRVGRQRAGHQRGVVEVFRFEESGQRIGCRELRAVQQRQAFLRAQHQRLQAGIGQCRRRRHADIADQHVANADHRRRHVRERREIAGGADRALAGDHRRQPLGQQRFEQFHGLDPHTGGALRQAAELERHHQPDDRYRHGTADAGGMRQHDVSLQCSKVRGIDPDTGQFAEAGIDPVDRRAFREDGGYGPGRGFDDGIGGRIDGGGGAPINLAPCRKRDGAGTQHYRLHLYLRTHAAARCRTIAQSRPRSMCTSPCAQRDLAPNIVP